MLRGGGGKKFISAEGNTQDDLLATYAYTLSLQPLICRVQVVSQAKDCWFADDATRCGPLQNVRVWWVELTMAGTDRVLSQCWKMQPKPYKEETARSIFEETAINITTEGRKHQGAAIGSTSSLKHYVNGRKRNGWGRFQNWLNLLCLTFGLKYRWTYFLGTLPDTEDLLAPLECAIADALKLSITDHNCTQAEHELLALPVRIGGICY